MIVADRTPETETPLLRSLTVDHIVELQRLYEADINIAILPESAHEGFSELERQQLRADCQYLALTQPGFRLALSGTEAELVQGLNSGLPTTLQHADVLARWLSQHIGIFAALFEPPAMYVRLVSLQQAMCPRFHVDHVPARLVASLYGPGTEWLAEYGADRQALGGNPRDPCQIPEAIQQLSCGDMALLKGEGWEGNEGRGLIHRSPVVSEGDSRLFFSIDFAAA
jgi:hypothetical protein